MDAASFTAGIFVGAAVYGLSDLLGQLVKALLDRRHAIRPIAEPVSTMKAGRNDQIVMLSADVFGQRVSVVCSRDSASTIAAALVMGPTDRRDVN